MLLSGIADETSPDRCKFCRTPMYLWSFEVFVEDDEAVYFTSLI